MYMFGLSIFTYMYEWMRAFGFAAPRTADITYEILLTLLQCEQPRKTTPKKQTFPLKIQLSYRIHFAFRRIFSKYPLLGISTLIVNKLNELNEGRNICLPTRNISKLRKKIKMKKIITKYKYFRLIDLSYNQLVM